MKVTVKFLSMMRQGTGIGRTEFSTSVDSLWAMAGEISSEYHIKDLLFLGTGGIRPYARILLNGRSKELAVEGVITKVRDGDVIALVYSFPYHGNV